MTPNCSSFVVEFRNCFLYRYLGSPSFYLQRVPEKFYYHPNLSSAPYLSLDYHPRHSLPLNHYLLLNWELKYLQDRVRYCLDPGFYLTVQDWWHQTILLGIKPGPFFCLPEYFLELDLILLCFNWSFLTSRLRSLYGFFSLKFEEFSTANTYLQVMYH